MTDQTVGTEFQPKGKAVPVAVQPVRAKPPTDSQAKKALARVQAKETLPGSAESPEQTAAAQSAARLAQIVNLHIAGYSLSQIGAAIGATADEVDRLLQADAARYVRSQPALRVYVRNWVSERYTRLLEAVWDEATDKTHREKLENQDRALRILDRMTKLHGAEAPVQSEVKVEAAPEAVEKLVQALAAGQGLGYDTSIFDVVDAEVVHDAHDEAVTALDAASEAVSGNQEGDDEPW